MSTYVGGLTYPTSIPENGCLVFSSAFECGNLGRVDVVHSGEYDLFIRPDTFNSRYTVWFYFECMNAKASQRVVFNIVNFSKQGSLFESGLASPVVRTSRQSSWSRVPSKHIYYYPSAVHDDRPILSVAYVFHSTEPVQFAYCIPYTHTYLQNYLQALEIRKYSYIQRELLCYSVQQNRVDLLTITSDEFSTTTRPLIFITGRVHPGETPSSHVIHGLLEFLTSSDERAVVLRKLYTFKIVPMLNPDGVILGNYRCNVMGFDLNREWRKPVEWAHPAIYHLKQLITHYNENPQTPIELFIDVHAHSQKPNSFLYGNTKGELDNDRQLWLPHILSSLADDYSLSSTQFNRNQEKEGTGRRTIGDLLNCACYTLEASFFSYVPSADVDNKPVPYLQYKYEALGESLGLSLLQYHEVSKGTRELTISRPFNTFVPVKNTKKITKSEKNTKK